MVQGVYIVSEMSVIVEVLYRLKHCALKRLRIYHQGNQKAWGTGHMVKEGVGVNGASMSVICLINYGNSIQTVQCFKP